MKILTRIQIKFSKAISPINKIAIILLILISSTALFAQDINKTDFKKDARFFYKNEGFSKYVFGEIEINKDYIYFTPTFKNNYLKKITIKIDSIKCIDRIPHRKLIIIRMMNSNSYTFSFNGKRKFYKILMPIICDTLITNKVNPNSSHIISNISLKVSSFGLPFIFNSYYFNGYYSINETSFKFRAIQSSYMIKDIEIKGSEIQLVKKSLLTKNIKIKTKSGLVYRFKINTNKDAFIENLKHIQNKQFSIEN